MLSFSIIITLWWALAETRYKQTGIVPTPVDTLRLIGDEMQKDSFLKPSVARLNGHLPVFLFPLHVQAFWLL